jgi:hypothetical protein
MAWWMSKGNTSITVSSAISKSQSQKLIGHGSLVRLFAQRILVYLNVK